MPNISSDPIKFTVWRQLFPEEPSKSQQTQIRIAEAAIRLYAKEGAEGATFEKIAKAAKVSRALVLRYFPKYSTLNSFMVKYVRAQFQDLAVTRMSEAVGPDAQLSAYVDSTFEWASNFSHHARVWLYFYFLSTLDKKLKEINTELVDIGHQRITRLILDGQRSGVFPKADASAAAKAIQTQITGTLVAILSENRAADFDAIRLATQRVAKFCLSIPPV